jgi:RNA polymerase sigma-70 factor (ECF subfamily)
MPDPNLILSALGGDPAAIGSLLAAAQPDIRRYARATCSAADVDDAVQDALCLLHRRIGTLRSVAAFSAWMFAVVRRECLLLARHGFGRTQELRTIEDDARFASLPEPELRLDLSAAISSLPEHYRQVLLLRDAEERTIAEIAERLDTTRETVKARLHRARILVREYIDR